MRYLPLLFLALFFTNKIQAQSAIANPAQPVSGGSNIYEIKKQFLKNVLHNPQEENTGKDDNDLERFNRWFHFVEPRCYPTGNMPRPGILLDEYEKAKGAKRLGAKTTLTGWQPLGPVNVPINYYGIGRIDCIVIDPIDTNTIYIGAACGGVWISHDGGTTWTTHTSDFPSLSIADIAVNPRHTDTLYAATGDKYGYVPHSMPIFWGGLYSAGVMKSVDGGTSWSTTGLSRIQSDRDMIQRLLIHPVNPNILLAATSHGIYRTADAGATWTVVDTGLVYSMAFRPNRPDTIYAVNTLNLRASYDAGLTWHTLYPAVNTTHNRCSIAVSPAAPKNIWLLDDGDNLSLSNDEGLTFNPLSSPSTIAGFYGFYDRVLGVSPLDSNLIFASGLNIAASDDGGSTWSYFDSSIYYVHPDNHAIAFNPLHRGTIFFGNDGGIVVTRDSGVSWTNISNGLMISQIYWMASSRQNPYIMLAGLQDNATFYNDGTSWLLSNGPYGDGMACAIFQGDDNFQIASTQNGNFQLSTDRGLTFNPFGMGFGGYWTSPVAFNPNTSDTFYYGLKDIYNNYGALTTTTPFPGGAVSLAVAPSNTNYIYAADFNHIIRTIDGGLTWSDVTGTLPVSTLPITRIAVDYTNPSRVYVTFSGYVSGQKVYMSNNAGASWTNISYALPNIPANCIAVDSTTPGALFIGTDIGVYYTDSSHVGSWSQYSTGLPNVIVDDIDINFRNYKVRAATYGRSIWECNLVNPGYPLAVKPVAPIVAELTPNPTHENWKLKFGSQLPATYEVKVYDMMGRCLLTQKNNDLIDASKLAPGVYQIGVFANGIHTTSKAVKY